MIDETISTIVLVLFGLLIGVILKVSLVYEQNLPRPHPTLHKKKNESILDFMRRLDVVSQEWTRKLNLNLPAMIPIGIFYSLIALLIVVLYFTPIHMNWLVFLFSVFVGFGIAEGIFSLAKAGKIRVKKQTFWDIGPQKELETRENQSNQSNSR